MIGFARHEERGAVYHQQADGAQAGQRHDKQSVAVARGRIGRIKVQDGIALNPAQPHGGPKL
jgi:hypothetical protein